MNLFKAFINSFVSFKTFSKYNIYGSIKDLCIAIKVGPNKSEKRMKRLCLVLLCSDFKIYSDDLKDLVTEIYTENYLFMNDFMLKTFGNINVFSPIKVCETFLKKQDAKKQNVYNSEINPLYVAHDDNKTYTVFKQSEFILTKKKEVEDILTKRINNHTLDMYHINLLLFRNIVKKCREQFNGGIIYMLKGGISLGITLMEHIDDIDIGHRDTFIKQVKILCGKGDNDTSILIDPSIKNYDYVHHTISNIINDEFESFIHDSCYALMRTEITNNSKSVLNENFVGELLTKNQQMRDLCDIKGEHGEFKEAVSSSLEISTLENCNMCLTQTNEKTHIFKSVNTTLKFIRGEKITCFDLYRTKLAFKIGEIKIMSELLDISLVRKSDSTVRSYFKKNNGTEGINYNEVIKLMHILSKNNENQK